MDRRGFLKLGLITFGAALLPEHQLLRRPPNLILIMADDLGYECLGCDGGSSYSTPNLDRMAREGVHFTRCYATPLCTPSRVEIMTGKYNFRNYTEFGCLRPGEKKFAHLLKQAGYRTCVVGKWQLAGRTPYTRYHARGTRPENAGFDEHCLWLVDKIGSRYWDPTITRNGELIERIPDRYGPDIFAEYAVDFIRRNRGRPFFLYYPMALTHAPFVPTPDSPDWRQFKHANDPRYFPDMVAYMDKIVGRILAVLRELRLERNTLVLFTGDNGTDRRIRSRIDGRTVQGRKGETVDAGTHVPLIGWWPGKVPAGRVCGDLVDFTDFLPTLLDAAGTSVPRDFVLDGRSFFPQLMGRKGNPREWIFCYYDPRWGRWKKSVFIQTRRWKLYEDGRVFDLAADPGEERPVQVENLPRDAKRRVEQLRATLQQMLAGAKRP